MDSAMLALDKSHPWASSPHGLTEAERKVYGCLYDILSKRERLGEKPNRIIVVTDLAKDYDDLAALLILKELHRVGLIKLLGFIASSRPVQKRAAFGRGALDSLGLGHIPIVCGADNSVKEYRESAYEFDCGFMSGMTDFGTGDKLFERLFSEEDEREQGKIHILCLASLRDLVGFTDADPEGLSRKLGSVHMQGGDSIRSGQFVPDMTAANNKFDWDAAIYWHQFLQEFKIPSCTYTKFAAFSVPLTTQLFKEVAQTGHPVGVHLRNTQMRQDLAFYKRACEREPAKRFAPHLDQGWFLKTRTNWYESHTEEDTPPEGEDVLPYVTKLVVYDALPALGVAGEDVVKKLGIFQPVPHIVNGLPTPHKIVGRSEENNDIGPHALAVTISALMKGALLALN